VAGENGKPIVGVVLGSASDMGKVQALFDTLAGFGVSYEVAVISAHRTPGLLREYAKSAPLRGIKVIIACAGLSAALPGALAGETDLPVIGLPLAVGPLNGIDALLSIAQMPPGVPVAALGIDSAKNAALMAVKILAVADIGLLRELSQARESMATEVRKKAEVLKDKGIPLWYPQHFEG